MRHALAALLAVVLLAVPAAAKGGRSELPADRLVVHEWGTFTSVQGSDGVALEGLQHEEEALPSFVYSRTEVRECPLRRVGWKGLEVPVDHVSQKMETPVLYFHTATPRRLRVRVDFVNGLITQWYPVSDLLGPPENELSKGPLDLSSVKRSFLEWDVDVIPRAAGAPAEIPGVDATDPWAFAREVDAAYVRTRPRQGPDRMGPTEAEQYLFYRGLGTFRVPVSAAVLPEGRVVALRNEGKGPPVRGIFALEVLEDGSLAWDRVEDVPSGGGRKFVFPSESVKARSDLEGLQAEVRRELEAQGLRADEAAAMVRTWTRSWFSTEGTRVFYVLPRPWVDALLPLAIDPAPDEVVRVLVGRLELVTPQVEAQVEKALKDRASDVPASREAAEARLARLGRFLEPHVLRVLAITKDEAVRASGREVLDGLRRP
jgi:hypothetical protein